MRRAPYLTLEKNTGQTDGRTDGRQTVTFRLPLDAVEVISELWRLLVTDGRSCSPAVQLLSCGSDVLMPRDNDEDEEELARWWCRERSDKNEITMRSSPTWGHNTMPMPVRPSVCLSHARGKKLRYRRETRATLCISWNVGLFLYELRIMQTDRVSTSEALSATATFYHATCIVLYTHRWSGLNYRTASMRCRACHKQTSIQPTLSMSTGPKLWCDRKLRLPPKLLMTPLISPPRRREPSWRTDTNFRR